MAKVDEVTICGSFMKLVKWLLASMKARTHATRIAETRINDSVHGHDLEASGMRS